MHAAPRICNLTSRKSAAFSVLIFFSGIESFLKFEGRGVDGSKEGREAKAADPLKTAGGHVFPRMWMLPT